MRVGMWIWAGLAWMLAGGDAIADPPAVAPYHLVNTMAVGGKGAWDYLTMDSASRRLYITRGNHVMVVNVDTGKSVGEIVDVPGVHGVALAPDLGRGFASFDGGVLLFDINTLKELGRVKAGGKPDGICYEPVSKRVFVFNGNSKDMTVIEGANGHTDGTIPVGGKPEFAVTDGQGTVFVNIEDTSQTLAIDARTLKIKSRWPLAPGDGPTGLAIDREHHRLFAVCGNAKMVVLNFDTGQVVTTLPIGKGADAVVYDPGTGMVFSSNGDDGSMTMLHEDSPTQFSTVGTVPTQSGARTMALDVKTHNVYLSAATLDPVVGKLLSRLRRGYKPNSFTILVFGK
jgi:DNA-binding beta-propeller fold protein YncE